MSQVDDHLTLPLPSASVIDRLQAALAGSACLGAWSHDVQAGRFELTPAFAALLGLEPAIEEVGLDTMLAGLHREDRLRIESVLHAAGETGGPFEAEFRTRSSARWLRLMGRCERAPENGTAISRGLAFDLTESRLAPGSTAERAQRQVNQLADHVIAMKGLAAALRHPPLEEAVQRVALVVACELARRVEGM